MESGKLADYSKLLIIFFIIIFSAVALWMRLIPAEAIVGDGGVNLLGNDPWYNLRQVEQTLPNFPQFANFDAMSLYPHGMNVPWGPLFTYILTFGCLLVGATTRPEIMTVASWIPPLMATAMVPLLYYLGRILKDWKTGLLAAAFMAVVSGQFFYRSLFGFVDHHIAEVFFSALFVLAYISTLIYTKKNPVDIKVISTIKIPVFLSFIVGLTFLLGYLVMPTMILFALIVAVYTLVQIGRDFVTGNNSDYLLVINGVVFSIATFGAFILGGGSGSSSLWVYTMGQVYAFFAVVVGTILLYVIKRAFIDKPKHYFALSIFGVAIIGSLLLMAFSPSLFDVLIGSFFGFFGEKATTLTVQEARPWDFESAWMTFHWGLLLMLGGMGVLIWRNWREEHPHQVFVLIWSVIILFSTMRHVRYEYYLAANIALLGAIFVGFALDAGSPALAGLLSQQKTKEVPEKTGKKAKSKGKKEKTTSVQSKTSSPGPAILLAAGILLSLLFVGSSLSADLQLAGNIGGGMNSDWMEALEWMGENTPETGVDYYAIYDRETFDYPAQSYGVMSWWDYGHWITFVAQRIPNANPFQAGVAGPNGAAAFFVQQSEEDSSTILDTLNTRYVITDIEMDTGKFWAMATWYDEDRGASGYEFRVANQNGQAVSLYTDDYFQTMIARLHNFDGSMVEAGAGIPQALGEYSGQKVSQLPVVPVEDVAALQHYRLIHESPSNVFNTDQIDLKYVKVFEYVPGATIEGEGIIEVPLVSNTGREFVYRQESAGGRFIVPYSTQGDRYEVRATGPYRIVETGETFEVSEDAVVTGLVAN
jgi:oligosaccharyl transferase (archaeosortase A-associated)